MDIGELITRVAGGYRPTVDEVARLLSVDSVEDIDLLYSEARRVTEERFGKDLFLYGFVYFSTYCRNNCTFCYYRRDNTIDRYRKTEDEVVTLSESLRDAGVNLVDLTMGEDPFMHTDHQKNLVKLVESVRNAVDLGIMVSPGAIEEQTFPRLADAGADFFAVYQEIYNRDLYGKLRVEQDYDARIMQRVLARRNGMLAEDGMLVGTGETVEDRADAILNMGDSGCEQIRAMTFVPQEGTPLRTLMPHDPSDELKAIAVMRLLFPDRLIPASLDVEGIAGLRTRVMAGANVITSIIPPYQELAGVAQPELNIDDGHRSVDYVKNMIGEMGLRPASNSEYRDYLESHRPGANE